MRPAYLEELITQHPDWSIAGTARYIREVFAEDPDIKRLTDSGLKTRVQRVRRALASKTNDPKPFVHKAINDRPLIMMLKVLWDGRRMPDEKLKPLFVKAAEAVEGVYADIAEAKLLIEKMRPAYRAKIEAEEAAVQCRMSEVADEIAKNRLVDMELKR